MNAQFHLCHLGLALALGACAGPVILRQDVAPKPVPTSSNEAVDFASLRGSLFGPRCMSCHAQYGDYAAVRDELEAIGAAVESDRMPKGGPPVSEVDKARLREWITIGAPETAGRPAEPPPTVALAPDYAALARLVFTPKCVVCHNPQGQARFLDLSNSAAFRANAMRVFGDKKLLDIALPSESYLLEVLRDPDEPMPPIWSNLARLSTDEIETIEEWIKRDLPLE